MALAADTILEIRELIGPDMDWVDNDPATENDSGSLETLWDKYGDVDRVALHVWRFRLAAHQERAFDIAQEGNWIARSQKTRMLREQVNKYERRARAGARGANAKITSAAEDQANITTTVAT